MPLVDNDKIEEIIQVSDIKEEDRDCIVTFLTVMTLIASTFLFFLFKERYIIVTMEFFIRHK